MVDNTDLKVTGVSELLKGKSIALCITGGIAAIEAPIIARQLRRYGAAVKIYATKESLKFVGESALEWATGQQAVSELSGIAEHIFFQDLILVAPATLNTINKIFAGIADNPVSTLLASALGKRLPILIAPTMHESLYSNPILVQNLNKAGSLGIKIIPPRIDEGKAKIPKTDVIVAEVCRSLSIDPLKGRKILVTGGPAPGKIDDVRVITNTFRGTLAIKIANELYLRGANVKLLLYNSGISVPSYLDTIYHRDYNEYYYNVFSELERGYEMGVFSAAVADYIPDKVFSGKIPSGGKLKEIKLVPTKKVIDEVHVRYPALKMVTFKFTIGVSREELLEIAKERIKNGSQLVVANRGEEMHGTHQAYIVSKDGVVRNPGSKDDIARLLVELMAR